MKHTIHCLFGAILVAHAPAQDQLPQLVPAESRLLCWMHAERLRELIGPDLLLLAKSHVDLDFGPESKRNDSIERFTREWGFDPFTDVKELAILGAPPGPSTLAVMASQRADRVLDRLKELRAGETRVHDGVELFSILPDRLAKALGVEPDEHAEAKEPVHVHRSVGRGSGDDRLLLIGQDAGLVAGLARAMVRRNAADGREPVRFPALRPGCLLFVAVDGPLTDLIGDDPRSRIASRANGFTLQLAEHDGTLRLFASIETSDSKDARQIACVVNGIKALTTLVALDDTEWPEVFAEAWHNAQARAEGKAVVFDVSLSGTYVRKALRELGTELQRKDRAGGGKR